jgi:hypothetical protein
MRGEESLAARAALCSKASSPFGFAGLLVELANPHFLLDSASFDKFAEAANGLLSRFLVS